MAIGTVTSSDWGGDHRASKVLEPCLIFFPCLGFVIYFSYGIHHSTEGSMARSSPDTEMTGFKQDHESEANSPEKEAFLNYAIDGQEEDDGDL